MAGAQLKLELEICGKAQPEAARGRKSDWGDILGGLNSVSSNVTWPECNRISLHRARSGDLGWIEMRQLNFVVSGPKFIKSFSSTSGDCLSIS